MPESSKKHGDVKEIPLEARTKAAEHLLRGEGTVDEIMAQLSSAINKQVPVQPAELSWEERWKNRQKYGSRSTHEECHGHDHTRRKPHPGN